MFLKYILTEHSPIIFDSCLNHSDIWMCTYSKVISGGMMQVIFTNNDIEVSVSGKSDSLKVDSRQIDSDILKKFLLYGEYQGI